MQSRSSKTGIPLFSRSRLNLYRCVVVPTPTSSGAVSVGTDLYTFNETEHFFTMLTHFIYLLVISPDLRPVDVSSVKRPQRTNSFVLNTYVWTDFNIVHRLVLPKDSLHSHFLFLRRLRNDRWSALYFYFPTKSPHRWLTVLCSTCHCNKSESLFYGDLPLSFGDAYLFDHCGAHHLVGTTEERTIVIVGGTWVAGSGRLCLGT
jgi:hypothetical protein